MFAVQSLAQKKKLSTTTIAAIENSAKRVLALQVKPELKPINEQTS
jgi:hypothetical protein